MPRFARLTLTMAAALALTAGLSDPASAQPPAGNAFRFDVFNNGTLVAGSLNVQQGTAFTLQVFLRQTGNPASGDVLVNEGLFGAGVRLNYGGTPLTAGQPAGTQGVINVANASDITRNPRFDDTPAFIGVANAQFADFTAAAVIAGTAQSGAIAEPGNANRVFLGAFTFQTPGAVGSSTALVIENRRVNSSDTISSQNGFTLDSVISSSSITVTVVPVPEPASLLAVSALGLAGAGWLRRRRAGVAA